MPPRKGEVPAGQTAEDPLIWTPLALSDEFVEAIAVFEGFSVRNARLILRLSSRFSVELPHTALKVVQRMKFGDPLGILRTETGSFRIRRVAPR